MDIFGPSHTHTHKRQLVECVLDCRDMEKPAGGESRTHDNVIYGLPGRDKTFAERTRGK